MTKSLKPISRLRQRMLGDMAIRKLNPNFYYPVVTPIRIYFDKRHSD